MAKIKKTGFFLAIVIGALCYMSALEAQASSKNMRNLPKNGINVDWPVLTDRQYFTHRGRNTRAVTLRSVMAFDCHKIMDLYDEDPQLAFDDLELLILVQFALRGLDIQTMDPTKRENIALAEIAKRLRQFGRLEETKALFQTPRVIPSVAGLCQILDEHKDDFLRQKYHVRHQWDLHKVADKAK